MKVVVSDSAKLDLLGIGDYIRAHNPERAPSFVEELLDHYNCEMPAVLAL